MSNTRFNPTANGDASLGILHLGHLYIALVNEHMAHSTGGEFIVRFDDNQKYWRKELGPQRIAENCGQIRAELEWFGLKVNAYISQLDSERYIANGIECVFPGLCEPDVHTHIPHLVREDSPQYPYAPYLTAQAVYSDALFGIDLLICGDELIDRYGLYCYMTEKLGLPQVEHVYLPRLRAGGELDEISKTRGTHKLQTYRQMGMQPADIEQVLRASCLIDPKGEWNWRNVKTQPKLSETPQSPLSVVGCHALSRLERIRREAIHP